MAITNGFDTTSNFHKERLIQQFRDGRPMGIHNDEDMEDVESELVLMILEGIDLSNITVRDVLKRLGVLKDGFG